LRQSSFVKALEEVLTGHSVQSGAIRYTNSQDRSFDLTISPIAGTKPDGSKRIQAMVFFFEVTSLLRTEQMRVDFVANASHELRTPLTTITGFIETLQGPAADDPDAQKRFLAIMQRESDRMKRLIDDLLSLSRIEMSRHDAPDEVVDINSIIKATVNACAPSGAERGVTFSLELDEEANKVQGDPDQLTQVFLNLLGNAAKYADRDTSVHILTNIDPLSEDQLYVTVRDEGPGISSEHLSRLTERFYRVDTARSRKMGGTGLGLAIVKHILLRHSSQLEIRSQVGVGTTFSFKLTKG
jgi:two-component system phosphate regulon sensor histidine kinase PhoR